MACCESLSSFLPWDVVSVCVRACVRARVRAYASSNVQYDESTTGRRVKLWLGAAQLWCGVAPSEVMLDVGEDGVET